MNKKRIKHKLIIIFIFLFSLNIFSNELDESYNLAIKLYQRKEYDIAKKYLLELKKKNYNNYLYFVLGKIYRYQDESKKAIEHLRKYIEISESRENRMYAQINLAYELVSQEHNSLENILEAVEIVDEIQKTEFKEFGDATFNYAVIYNTYGFYYLKNDIDRSRGVNYYKKNVVVNFEKALAKRPEIIKIANNLVVSYFIVIDKLLTDKDKYEQEIKKYKDKAKAIFQNPLYIDIEEGKFADNRDYFNKNYLE